jgi:hypothetical protein
MINLLLNGDFEEEFHLWRSHDELRVAEGWTPWWLDRAGTDPAWKNRRPEYKRVKLYVEPTRVRKGKYSQQYSTDWGTHIAGLWQQAVVTSGSRLRLRAWGHAWSSEADKPQPSQNPTQIHMCVGIDPLGGTDPMSQSVVWSEEHNAIDKWHPFEVEVRAKTDLVTLFLRSAPEWPKKRQSVYWDQADLEVVEQGPEGAPSSGGDNRARLKVSPEQPGPGMEISVRALLPFAPADVRLVARGPTGEILPVLRAEIGRRRDEHVWEYSLRPNTTGTHTLVFGSDMGSRVICWTRLQVGGEEAVPTVERGEGTEAGLPLGSSRPGPAAGGPPRLQYTRTYVLLPPTADAEWAAAAMRGSFDARRTVGFSADDAGVGDLEERRVIAVNPHHWHQELTADWFADHYPGVKFHSLTVKTPEDLARSLRNWRD